MRQVEWARDISGRPEMSKTLLIALVENVLGFQRVEDVSDSSLWVWRRDVPFERDV